ncbi:MAG: M18 family aminopeptidase [Arenicellales bacterium]
MANTEFVDDFLAFLRASPTPFHAVANIAGRLERSGFVRLREHEDWRLDKDGRYYVVRNGSSIVAFSNTGEPGIQGIRMVGTHTDSPCLKIKPRPERVKNGYFQLSAEVYGGALLNPWFDRDLSIAGRVTLQTGDRSLVHRLIDFERPLGVIPSLAIHLDREANNSRSINAQTDILPLLLRTSEEGLELRSLLADRLAKEHPDYASAEILDFELCLYDTQPPAVVGVRDEFISGARLDNLASCFIAVRAIVDHEHTRPVLMVCNDHEEVGSQSAVGADGPFLRDVIHRWLGDRSAMAGAMDSSLLVSADNAHGVHPNYPDKHDENHGPVLNGGPVIKVNQSQRYATNSETGSIFRAICLSAEVPVQSFVSRADMACGTTIGPITAGGVGVKTVDVGIPQLAMHSIRETCGAADPEYLYRALKAFFDTEQLQAAEAF